MSIEINVLFQGPLPAKSALTRAMKAELQRLKSAAQDEDQFANEQLPNGVDGPPAKLRGK